VAISNTARDFVETPSQMFEEWAWSREVLDLFARHPDSGEPIPTPLYEAMIRARRFGMSLATERQLFLARLDLAYHTQEPGFDTTKLLQRIHQKHFSYFYGLGMHKSLDCFVYKITGNKNQHYPIYKCC